MNLHFSNQDTTGVAGVRPEKSRSLENVLDVLEHFGQSLQQCGQSRQQIRLILESVCATLGADAVYWDPGTTSDPVETIGRVGLGSEWCRNFTIRLLVDELGTPPQILRTHLTPELTDGPVPRSAALVRISRSRGSWLGAVSCNPHRSFDAGDVKAMLLARRILLNHRQQTQVQDKLRDSLFGLVHCLTAAIDAKDPFTGGHSERVARIAVRLGKQMNVPANLLGELYLGGLLHDIGKIGIRDNVLQKPRALTDEERLHMQEHVLIGDRLLSVVPLLAHLRPGVRNHHERIDGKGYPDGLAGQDIPLVARILAVADACDAMMATRPYRSALAPARIDAIMTAGADAQWDTIVVQHFMACRHELYSICQRGLGDSVLAAVDRVLERVQTLGDSTWETQSAPRTGIW